MDKTDQESVVLDYSGTYERSADKDREFEDEMKEPDYNTASSSQLVEWCQYLKYKFDIYINQSLEREDSLLNDLQSKNDRVEDLENELQAISSSHEEEIRQYTNRLKRQENDFQLLDLKFNEVKTSLGNLTKGFRSREHELKSELSTVHRALRKMYDMNVYIRDGTRTLCERLCGDLVTVEDTTKALQAIFQSPYMETRQLSTITDQSSNSNEVDSLYDEINRLKGLLEIQSQNQQQAVEMKEEAAEKEREAEVQAALADSQELIDSLVKSVNHYKNENKSLLDRISVLKQDSEEKENLLNEQFNDVLRLQQNLNSSSEVIKSLEKQNQYLSNDLDQERDIRKRLEELASANNEPETTKFMDKISTELIAKAKDTEIARLQKALDESQSLLESTSEALVSSTNHYKSLLDSSTKENQALHEKIESLQQDIYDVESESQTQRAAIEENNKQNSDQYNEIARLQHSIHSYKEIVKKLELEIQFLSSELEEQKELQKRLEMNIFEKNDEATKLSSALGFDIDSPRTNYVDGYDSGYDETNDLSVDDYSSVLDKLLEQIENEKIDLEENLKSFSIQSKYVHTKAVEISQNLAEQ